MNLEKAIEAVMEGAVLSEVEASDIMSAMIVPEASVAQVAALLIAMRMRGVQSVELTGFVKELRTQAVKVQTSSDRLVDTCGTGGGYPSFNLSTGAAIVAAAAGARVAKHGNRAVTSKCGSADVLESLGVKMADSAATAADELKRLGITFLFAPAFHPGLKNVGALRRELKVRTVFNILGPLLNPAGANRQVIGVYRPEFVRPMAETLLQLGCERAMVVHGAGMDEISVTEPSTAIKVEHGRLTEWTLYPSTFGLGDGIDISPGDTLEESAEILLQALSPGNISRNEALIPGSAAALWAAGVIEDLPAGAELARNTIESGAARAKLEAWRS